MATLRRPLRQILPWIVSGASGWYIMRRARQLSVEEPSAETLPQFLAHKGDLLIVIVGSPTVWHFTRRSRALLHGANSSAAPSMAEHFHQLRQVFTVLTLGLELLRRRLLSGETNPMLPLLTILQRVLLHGQEALRALEHGCADSSGSVTTVGSTTGQRNEQSE